MLTQKQCHRVTWLLTQSEQLKLQARYTEAAQLSEIVEQVARGLEPPLHDYEISQRRSLASIRNEYERNLKAKEMGI